MITAEVAALAQSSQTTATKLLLIQEYALNLVLRFAVRLEVSLNERSVALEVANLPQVVSQIRVHGAKHVPLQDTVDDFGHFVACFRFLDLLLVVALTKQD